MAPSRSHLRSVRTVKHPSGVRSTRKHVSYREQTSDSDREEFRHSASDDDFQSPASRPQRHCAPPRAPVTPSLQKKTAKKRKASGPGHRQPDAEIKRPRLSEVDPDFRKHGDAAVNFTGKTMPWPTLPYHILLAIFDYASRPLVENISQPTASIKWLHDVALCCKAFAEPALSTLYYSPPLQPPSRAHRLLSHLAAHADTATFNYGAKIKYLDIEVSSIMLHKFDGWDPLDLAALVSHTPQLRGIALHLRSDGLAWRKSGRSRSVASSKAAYHRSTITALHENKIMLRDWTWNYSLARQSQSAFPFTQMKDFHMLPPFQTLGSLTLVNYPAGPIEKGRFHEDILAEAINLLPRLAHLHFYLSSVNKRLLSQLPHSLETLEIVECPVLKSSALNSFLAAKGMNMRRLILNHNQSLNLSFLTDLAQNCPNLVLLKADLRYFGILNVTRDTDPKYDALLLDGQRPNWPMSLQALELFHLRKWKPQTAELFFASLTDSGGMLPRLRQIKIKATIDESGWRERIAFRDNWTEKLQRVFRCESPPPNPHLTSISAFKRFKAQQKRSKAATGGGKGQSLARVNASQVHNEGIVQAGRAKVAPKPAGQAASESDSDAPLLKVRRSTRAKAQRENIYKLSTSPPSRPNAPRRRRRRRNPDDSSSEDSAIDDDGVPEPDGSQRASSVDRGAEVNAQGLCEVVDVLIDNLRPTEEQLKEADFLDEEASGDEDWDGDDGMPVDSGYAW